MGPLIPLKKFPERKMKISKLLMVCMRSPDRLTASFLSLRRGDDEDCGVRHHVKRRRSGDLVRKIDCGVRHHHAEIKRRWSGDLVRSICKVWMLMLVVFSPVYPCLAQEQSAPQNKAEEALPYLHTVGVIPLLVDTTPSASDTIGLESVLSHLRSSFSSSLRESGRFSVLDDELVANFWKDPLSRQRLVDDYEVSAFMNVIAVPMKDTVTLIVRLLAPDLTLYLQDIQVLDRIRLQHADKEDESTLKRICQNQIFRLLNRLPIDVSIRFVQGRYVTISGGKQAGLKIGDEFDLVRPFITERHPADQTWLEYESQVVAKVKIIEQDGASSIGLLTSLVRKNDIQIGDGIKIYNLNSRSFFAKKQDLKKELWQGEDDSLIWRTKQPDASVAEAAVVSPPQKTLVEPVVQNNKMDTAGKEEGIKKEPGAESSEASSFDEKLKKVLSPADIQKFFSDHIPKSITFLLNQEQWSYTGPGKTKSAFVWYLPINTFGLSFQKRLFYKIEYEVGLKMGFGKTSKKNGYSTYAADLNIFWKDEFPADFILESWSLGMHSAYSGLVVNLGPFGGYDLFGGGVFGEVDKIIPIAEEKHRLSVGGRVVPLNLGRVGYGNRFRSTESSLAWEIHSELYRLTSKMENEWGFGAGYSQLSILDSAKAQLSLSKFYIQLLISKKF